LSLILNINTATEIASVCLAQNKEVLAQKENEVQKEHASFIHEAIRDVMETAGKELNRLDAVAVTAGPGSYTGLRVGMATAKGLCYALRKPLITVNTLEVMTQAALQKEAHPSNILFCPMIDARRMEVFTALYTSQLANLQSPSALILEADSFDKWLQNHTILFFGNGSEKFGDIVNNENAMFKGVDFTAKDLAFLSHNHFVEKDFANLAYVEPIYIKEFFSK
jgi:tRNA threonylcarbamoyladenosine biosynthesis protein TsaB